MLAPEIETIIREECEKHKIDPLVMLSIVAVESGGAPKVARYERQYAYLFKDLEYSKLLKITLDTERMFQKTSWGLSQIMGASARWLGFSGWIPDLCDPRTNMQWACIFFKKVCDKQIYLNEKISVYNAGSIRRKSDGTYVNQEYIDKVLAVYGQIQTSKEKVPYLS